MRTGSEGSQFKAYCRDSESHMSRTAVRGICLGKEDLNKLPVLRQSALD